jgi:hypothetical protein
MNYKQSDDIETYMSIEDLRTNTVSDCFYCTKDSKDCAICVWTRL